MTIQTRVNLEVVPPSPGPSAIAPASAPPVQAQAHRRAAMPLVVAGSMTTALVAAMSLVAAPVVPASETALTGAVLVGFAIGWAVLARLSARFTARVQRWAAVPAAVLGASGLVLLAFGSSAHRVLDWAWPPVLLGLALWMAVQARRDLGSRAARWLLYPAIGAMGLAAVGGGYQTLGTAMEPSSSMPGRLVDVGGHRLHLSCSGTGSPTVVLETGAGAMAANFGWIAPAVAPETTVCAYDRAGRGWSEDADSPQDALRISTDLHTLLQRAGVPGPYVMAGHSFGGLYTLNFAANHPDEVAGMVLIDATSPNYGNPARSRAHRASSTSYDVVGRVAALTSSLSRLGLGRLYAALAPVDLPPREQAQVQASTATPATLRSTIEEYGRANTSTVQAATLRTLGDKPLMVLSASVGNSAGWPAKQERLAALSTDSVHRVVDGASHDALVGDETHAATTSRAILEVVSAVRSGQPLRVG